MKTVNIEHHNHQILSDLSRRGGSAALDISLCCEFVAPGSSRQDPREAAGVESAMV